MEAGMNGQEGESQQDVSLVAEGTCVSQGN